MVYREIKPRVWAIFDGDQIIDGYYFGAQDLGMVTLLSGLVHYWKSFKEEDPSGFEKEIKMRSLRKEDS